MIIQKWEDYRGISLTHNISAFLYIYIYLFFNIKNRFLCYGRFRKRQVISFFSFLVSDRAKFWRYHAWEFCCTILDCAYSMKVFQYAVSDIHYSSWYFPMSSKLKLSLPSVLQTLFIWLYCIWRLHAYW